MPFKKLHDARNKRKREALPPANDDKIATIQRQVEGTKQVALDVLGQIHDRQAKLERLEEQTNALVDETEKFKRKAKKVKWHEWWQEKKAAVMVGSGSAATVAATVALVVLLV